MLSYGIVLPFGLGVSLIVLIKQSFARDEFFGLKQIVGCVVFAAMNSYCLATALLLLAPYGMNTSKSLNEAKKIEVKLAKLKTKPKPERKYRKRDIDFAGLILCSS